MEQPADGLDPTRGVDDGADAWFRAPTRREHCLGAGLFVGFGVFFVLLFIVLDGWGFRWTILALGVISVLRGLRHGWDACRPPGPSSKGPGPL